MKKGKRFAYKFGTVNYVLMGVMIAIFVGYTVYTILKLCKVGDLVSYMPALDGVMLGLLSLLTGYVVVLIFHSCYKVTDKYVDVYNLKHIKIETDKLLLLRYELSSKMTVLYYADKDAPDGVGFVVVNVFEKDRQAFVAAVQEVNPSVGMEIFDQSKRDRDTNE